MTGDGAAIVRSTMTDAILLHQRTIAASVQPVVDAASAIAAALSGGGKLLAFGNGGSAGDAQHLAAELVGRFENHERAALAAVALSADGSVLTSIGNDEGFERVFARQIEALARQGDVALGITTSGASANVVSALESARARGVQTIALTGRDGGAAGRAAAIHINVASDSTPRVQEVHRTLLHVICELVEKALA